MNVLELAKKLITRPSITPDDAGCQNIINQILTSLNFNVEHLNFGPVKNLWATHNQNQGRPLLVFAGHTDVVPPGDNNKWHSPPFTPTVKDNKLYGRGAADMKGALAAMLIAVSNFIQQYPNYNGSIGFLITSDEEGEALEGTQAVINYLQAKQQAIDYCIIGEPTSINTVGDTIKYGRRGSMSAQLTIHGTQGHVAYPERADNPIHKALAALDNISNHSWENNFSKENCFPASSLQITYLTSGTNAANNVIPADLICHFNIRFSNNISPSDIKSIVSNYLRDLPHSIVWRINGQPYLTKSTELISACQHAVTKVTGKPSSLSTSGGTSDGRFIATLNPEIQVVELGLVNHSIHAINEHTDCHDLEILTEIYKQCLHQILE